MLLTWILLAVLVLVLLAAAGAFCWASDVQTLLVEQAHLDIEIENLQAEITRLNEENNHLLAQNTVLHRRYGDLLIINATQSQPHAG